MMRVVSSGSSSLMLECYPARNDSVRRVLAIPCEGGSDRRSQATIADGDLVGVAL